LSESAFTYIIPPIMTIWCTIDRCPKLLRSAERGSVCRTHTRYIFCRCITILSFHIDPILILWNSSNGRTHLPWTTTAIIIIPIYLSNTYLITINFSASAIRVSPHYTILLLYIDSTRRQRPRPVGTHYFLLSRPARNQLDRLCWFIHRLSPPPSRLIQEN